MLTRWARSMRAPDSTPVVVGGVLAAGIFLNRSAVVRAPVVVKSRGLRFVTGTPTAVAP